VCVYARMARASERENSGLTVLFEGEKKYLRRAPEYIIYNIMLFNNRNEDEPKK